MDVYQLIPLHTVDTGTRVDYSPPLVLKLWGRKITVERPDPRQPDAGHQLHIAPLPDFLKAPDPGWRVEPKHADHISDNQMIETPLGRMSHAALQDADFREVEELREQIEQLYFEAVMLKGATRERAEEIAARQAEEEIHLHGFKDALARANQWRNRADLVHGSNPRNVLRAIGNGAIPGRAVEALVEERTGVGEEDVHEMRAQIEALQATVAQLTAASKPAARNRKKSSDAADA